MNAPSLQHLYRTSHANPVPHAALTLLLLNGLNIDQIAALDLSAADLVGGWLMTASGSTYPLTTYTVTALRALENIPPARLADELRAAAHQLEPVEDEAHRWLAGAIWITDADLKLTLELAGSPETPPLPLRYTFPFSVTERLQPGETSPIAVQGRQVLQAAADWLVVQALTPGVPLSQRLLGMLRQGSLIFMLASTGVSGLNLIHNVIMGRLLSPADYSQLTFVITLQLLIGLLPTALQTVTARFTARYRAQNDDTRLRALRWFGGRVGWITGGIALVTLTLMAPLMTAWFQLNDIWLLLPVISLLPLFIRTGADRGVLQGAGSYLWLSGAYVSEAAIRLGASVLLGYALLNVGRSLEGAIWGLAQSMLGTWFIGWLALRHLPRRVSAVPPNAVDERPEWMRLAGLTLLALIGQALITNSDFLLVKNFFTPEEAGLYAAISVLGRIVYFGALPLTIVLVPMIARRQALDQPTRSVLLLLIGGGAAVCGLLIVGAVLFGGTVVGLLYGEAYAQAAGLLAPYALAASLYTVTNLVITYQIARGSGGETWLPLLAGGAQIVGILLFHESLAQVITVQIALMALLLSFVLLRVLRPEPARVVPSLPATVTGS